MVVIIAIITSLIVHFTILLLLSKSLGRQQFEAMQAECRMNQSLTLHQPLHHGCFFTSLCQLLS